MNERIKELARQAGLLSARVEGTKTRVLLATVPETNGEIADPDTQLEKFAELIVRECILTIQMGITRDGHNTEKYLRSMKHLKDIKEHFGVEEK